MKTARILPCAAAVLAIALVTWAHARINVSTAGTSNGVAVNSNATTKKIDRLVYVKAKGGSIKSARARGKYTKRRVILGNRVIAKDGIAGDPLPTHVDANSVFVGTAKFVAAKRGATVPNFTVNMRVHGSLKCKTPDLLAPLGQGVAGVAVDIVVDGNSLFAGTALQDAKGPLVATGDFLGEFTAVPHEASIGKTFPLNFGTLTDGQRLRVVFVGSTLVSFAPDFPLDYARANFYRTSSFSPAAGQGGTLALSAAKKKVDVAYVTVTVAPPEYALYIESADLSVINNIQSGSVRVVAPTFGYLGGPSVLEAIAGPPADIDSDSIPDVRLTFADPQADTYLLASNTIVVAGETTLGEPFYGILIRTAP